MARIKNSPKSPGSGRRKGSIDLAERKLLSDKMAADLMECYERMGGVEYLVKIATDDPKTFLAQGLSRLFPAPLRDDPEILLQQLNQYNIDGISNFEAARRIAFALSRAMAESQITPQEACSLTPLERVEPRWIDPATLPPTEPQFSQEEVAQLAKAKAAQDLIGLYPYGKADEHGLRPPKATVETKRTRIGVPPRR